MLRKALFAVYVLFATSALVFVALEVPGLQQAAAPDLPYYVMKRAYSPDPALVFAHRFRGEPAQMDLEFRGDLYWEGYGVEAAPIRVRASYDTTGFRTNSSRPPYDVVVIGDSYVELSETDRNTFTEKLAATSGRSIFNMGTAWYGPYQYLELLKRRATALRPRYVVFAFYAGNDIEDIEQYERWRREGRYYGQDTRYWESSLPRRYATVMGQAVSRGADRMMHALYTTKAWLTGWERPEVAPDLALVRVGGETVPMAMGPWTAEAPASELLATHSWRTLRTLLGDFRRTSVEHGITPVVVYLPTKMQSYAHQVTPESGELVARRLASQRKYSTGSAEALATIAGELDLCFVDLLPEFQRLASQGELLYHPFDTHWNERGRAAAAEIVSARMGWFPAAGPAPSQSPACSPREAP